MLAWSYNLRSGSVLVQNRYINNLLYADMPIFSCDIMLHSELILPHKYVFRLIFSCIKIKLFKNFEVCIHSKKSKIFSRPLEYLKKFPHKDLKMFSTDFIFRQQKILLTTRIVVLKSCYYATKYYGCPGWSCFSATCLQTKLILPNALPVMYLDKKSETVFAA